MKILYISILFVFYACKKSDDFVSDGVYNEPIIANGCPDVNYPDWASSAHVLPYPIGVKYKIGLSNCSGSFHAIGGPDQYAIDFDMPIGSLITATSAGQVVHIEQSGADFNFPNNYIVVSGSGGYMQYMHLTQNGALVNVGDQVAQGDTIGLSGATGLAGYPHLHLVLTSGNWEFPYSSSPITFKNTSPNPKSLIQNEEYTAMPY